MRSILELRRANFNQFGNEKKQVNLKSFVKEKKENKRTKKHDVKRNIRKNQK